jgi:hypothetical protein
MFLTLDAFTYEEPSARVPENVADDGESEIEINESQALSVTTP